MGVDGSSCVENKITKGDVMGLSIGRVVYLDIDIGITIGRVSKRQAESPVLKSSRNEE